MSDKRMLPAELWRAVEDRHGVWWIEDQHGDTINGPFANPIEANEKIRDSQELQLRLRDVMDLQRERRTQPMESENG